MSGFFGLINNILVDIVHNWIEFQDLIKVDTACCNKKARGRFLDILLRKELLCNIECVSIYVTRPCKPFQWVQDRQVNALFFNVKTNSECIYIKSVKEQASQIVSLTILTECYDVDDDKLMTHLSLFQNLKSLKFGSYYIPNYDTFLKIDPKILNQLTTLHLQGENDQNCKEEGCISWFTVTVDWYGYILFLDSIADACPNLTDLTLLISHHFDDLVDDSLTFLSGLKHLKTLEIWSTLKCFKNDLQCIIDNCHSTIVKLQIWVLLPDTMSKIEHSQLKKFIEHCPHLMEFNLYHFWKEDAIDRAGAPRSCWQFIANNDQLMFGFKRIPSSGNCGNSIELKLQDVANKSFRLSDILSIFSVIPKLTLIKMSGKRYTKKFLNSLEKVHVQELILHQCDYPKLIELFNGSMYKKLTIENNHFNSWGMRLSSDTYVNCTYPTHVEHVTIINSAGLSNPQYIYLRNPALKSIHFVDCLDLDGGKLMQWWENSDKSVAITFDTKMRNSKGKVSVLGALFNWFSGV